MSVVTVNSSAYLGIARPERLAAELTVSVADRAYEPRLADLRSDWVASAAVPAFKAHRQRRGPARSFCSIGTGSGLDVLAAIELLEAERVGLTDVHAEVVLTAAGNVRRNVRPALPLTVEAGHGDLLEPLRRYGSRYEVIYENLPNVPADSEADATAARNSGTYVPPRREPVPELVRRHMLDLHFIALAQARDFLAAGGVMYSCLGARVPLTVLLRLGELAGYRAAIATYGWKLQGDPELVLREHADREARGFGPFHFYRAEILERFFAGISPADGGERALELEEQLQPRQLSASAALAEFQRGAAIGHTVAFLQSEEKNS
ncbi:MAG: hypothetical protein LBK76_04230 [Verrucomicrobiales bacterium]|jgi:hypothetical protein|nr:hypothetical protein [Verrucomicrobiales bacterium]